MFKMTKLQPVNRHLSLVLHPEKETKASSPVLLPEDYSPKSDKYVLATVVGISEDCATAIKSLKTLPSELRVVVVDRAMIEEVRIDDRTHHLVLENYVVGLVKDLNEN